jgi:hypothetical protein
VGIVLGSKWVLNIYNNEGASFEDPVFQGDFRGASITVTNSIHNTTIPVPKIDFETIQEFKPIIGFFYQGNGAYLEPESDELLSLREMSIKNRLNITEKLLYKSESELIIDTLYIIKDLSLTITSPTLIEVKLTETSDGIMFQRYEWCSNKGDVFNGCRISLNNVQNSRYTIEIITERMDTNINIAYEYT